MASTAMCDQRASSKTAAWYLTLLETSTVSWPGPLSVSCDVHSVCRHARAIRCHRRPDNFNYETGTIVPRTSEGRGSNQAPHGSARSYPSRSGSLHWEPEPRVRGAWSQTAFDAHHDPTAARGPWHPGRVID